MTRQEKNRLIAEFMDYPLDDDGYVTPHDNEYHDSRYGRMTTKTWPPSWLRFHTSWDWLMPVVEKIESLGFKSCIENHFCSFDGNSEDTDGIWFENTNPPTSKMDAVIQAVILFIEWYNQNKQS